MTFPRLTIFRLMIAVAGVAGLLALGRLIGHGLVAFLTTSIGSGWVVWLVCRRHPRFIVRGYLATSGCGIVLTILGWLVGDVHPLLGGLVALVFIYPAFFGCGFAWLNDHEPLGSARRPEPADLLFLFLTFCPILIVVPCYFLAFIVLMTMMTSK